MRRFQLADLHEAPKTEGTHVNDPLPLCALDRRQRRALLLLLRIELTLRRRGKLERNVWLSPRLHAACTQPFLLRSE